MDQPSHADLYRQMLRIRRFEETVLEQFPQGDFYGTTHTYIGQEADAVGVLSWLNEGDVVVSNHRCHGHFLAYGGSMQALAAELMGRAGGVCGGRGGSQHLQWKDFYANGILGGTLPLAAGMAMAEKIYDSGRVVFAFMGDGTLGEGVVYESLNMASLWGLPIVYVLENNRYAQSTPIKLNLAGSIGDRFRAFGIPAHEASTTDVLDIQAIASQAVKQVRTGAGPQALVLETYRFAPHSKGDDTRDPAEIERYRQDDPLQVHGSRIPEAERKAIDESVEREVTAAFEAARAQPAADPVTLKPALGGSG
ncbi:MAG: thiamine pyrophosphate-dependent dehydrogenase E1 component subunit alpha [Anaerolineales bacterium]|jgi:TPP-dependent pyruvate/acetoin dehydrogenase alpha subunit